MQRPALEIATRSPTLTVSSARASRVWNSTTAARAGPLFPDALPLAVAGHARWLEGAIGRRIGRTDRGLGRNGGELIRIGQVRFDRRHDDAYVDVDQVHAGQRHARLCIDNDPL